jgi:transketolase
LIIVKTIIGYGSPNKANTSKAHGEALGAEEIKLTKAAYGWPENESFLVPPEVPEHFQNTLGERGRDAREAWEELFQKYTAAHPELAEQINLMQRNELPKGWDKEIVTFPADAKGNATRNSGGKALNAFAKNIPWLVGGSADLAPSTKTLLEFDGTGSFSAEDFAGRNFHFGIREHAMAAAVNGMVLSGLRAYGATFFVFSDYCRPSLRLAAIMNLPSVFVFTHDSIGVGEDGPTHQPVEQLAALRAIPNLLLIRPGDANESVYAWKAALANNHRPSAIILTRQNMPTLDREKYAAADGVMKGGYILSDAPGGKPDVILMGTGSELSIAVAAQEELAKSGIKARVVSLPCFELFDEQPQSYQDEVLPPTVTARVAVEAGVRQGWDRYLAGRGAFIGMHGFGMSAPFEQIYKAVGITPEKMVEAAKKQLGK